MLDLSPVFRKEKTFREICADLSIDDLRSYTNKIIDTIQDLVADCVDDDVVFYPQDPEADDQYAASEEERNISWTLGHVIVHTTAGSEEGAFSAAELARGVENHGRTRYETPWETMQTMDQVRHRLEESRRMRLACLDVWPDEPHLDNTYHVDFLGEDINAVGAFVLGLGHETSHLAQIKEIVRQAKAARS